MLTDSALHALLCELAAVNPGMCLITSRFPVKDLEDCHDSHREFRLGCLDPTDGALVLGAHGVRGSEAELRNASADFGGHCLALTLLANYLNDAFDGDVAFRARIGALQGDIRQ